MKIKKAVSLILFAAALSAALVLFLFFKHAGPDGAVCGRVRFPSGAEIKCELAVTSSQHALGLMFRKELQIGRGMLFVFNEDVERTFWMKNTFIPLDMVFIGKDREVRRIFNGVQPYKEKMKDDDISRAGAPAGYVLEISSGAASAGGLKEGDRVGITYFRDPADCR